MHSAQPLDILFEEAGASLGRIERELRLKDEARAARFEARLAAIELAAFKAEEERQRKFEARMAELHDGKDGEPGKDGRDGADADIEPLCRSVNEQMIGIRRDYAELTDDLKRKLAEIKDGKDGEPGKDGRDADIAPIANRFEELQSLLFDYYDQTSKNFAAKVDAKLAEVQDGKDGEPGPMGPSGKDGKDGKMPISRLWTDGVHYEGDIVRHNGATYQALKNTGREPPHSDWGEMAGRGTDGRGFLLRGTYDAAAEYRQHDIVMLNRNSFAAKYDGPGECPGNGWQLFGPSGGRGKEGPPGAKGTDGRSVSIASVESDPDAMVLKITDSSGKTFTVDLGIIAERIVEAAR